MKTEQQVRDKLKEHEDKIYEILDEGISSDFSAARLEMLGFGRKFCLWWLSDKSLIKPDELDKKIKWELTCFESSKIF